GGADDPADDVRRGERGRDEQQHVADHAVHEAGKDDHTDEHHAVDGVRAGHQRGVQRGRDLADDLEPHEQRQDEDRHVADEGACHGVASRSFAVASWTTVPLWVMTTPRWISSSRSMASCPSDRRGSSNGLILRAYALDALVGICAGRLPAPMTVTPLFVTIVSPGSEISTLPPRSLAAMSTITEPARMLFTVSAVTMSGGRRPGTCAVVIT